MEHIRPPEHVLAARPWTEAAEVLPPPGDETGIGTAYMARGVDPTNDLPVNYAHFALDDEEVAALVAGGTVEIGLIGWKIQPFSLAVWVAGPREPA